MPQMPPQQGEMPPQGPRPPQANGPMPLMPGSPNPGMQTQAPQGPQPYQQPAQPGQQPIQQPSPSAYDEQNKPIVRALSRALQKANLAEDLDEDELNELGDWAKRGYDSDKGSRSEWEQDYQKWLEQAMQVAKTKNFPWVNASNVKFPILSIAAMQFSARAYPTLVPSDRQVFKRKVVGYDADGQKARKGEMLSYFMSWQIMEYMKGWEEDMDRLLIMLPIVGTVFKKIWWDFERECPKSELVSAYDLVVNYWAKDICSAERKTQVRRFTKRQIMEKINAGLFLDVLDKLGEPSGEELPTRDEISKLNAPSEDREDTPYAFGEMHCFYDVDGDEYPEPVIITFDLVSGLVLRVAARYEADDVKTTADGKLLRIDPSEHFVQYGMFPNPTGGCCSVGFGTVLGPLNDSVGTIINQLIDSGTLANMQGGWMSKGLKIKQGDTSFRPGQWQQVNGVMDDLRKGVLPHQYKEPSNVLFQLLGMLVHTSRELASVSDTMTGKMPGQNTPAYTTREVTEQGMKVFTACYKRVFSGMTQEFRRLYKLNRIHMEEGEVMRILDTPDAVGLFDIEIDDVVPAADPAAMSAASKSQKAQQFMQLLQQGAINRKAGLMKVLEYEEVPLTPELLAPLEPPPPDPKVEMEKQKFQSELQMKEKEHQFKLEEMQTKLQMERDQLAIEKEKMQMELQLEREKLGIEQQKNQMELQKAQTDLQLSQQQADQKSLMMQKEHNLGLEHMKESHKAEMQMTQEKVNAKKKKKRSVGKENADGSFSIETTEE